MEILRDDINKFHDKIDSKLNLENEKILKIDKTLHLKFSKIPNDIYKNLDEYKENIVKYQEILKLDYEKKLELDIGNPDITNFFSLFFNIHDTILFFIINNKKTYEINKDEILQIEKYSSNLYYFLTKKLLEKYNYKFFENKNKIKIFNLIKQPLKLNEYFKDDEEYILNKFKKFENYLNSNNFLFDVDEIHKEDFLNKNDEQSLLKLKNLILETKNSLNNISKKIKIEEDKSLLNKSKQKNKNILKNYNQYHTESNSYIDIKKKKKDLVKIRNEKDLLIFNKKNLLEKKNNYLNNKELNSLEKEHINLVKQIEILGNKGNIQIKEKIVKDRIVLCKSNIEMEIFLLDNKINKNDENIKNLLIKEKDLELNYKGVLDKLEKKIQKKDDNILVELYKEQKSINGLLLEYEKSYMTLKGKVYINNNKLKKKQFTFLKKNKEKVLLYEKKNEIILNLNRYLHILKDDQSRTQLYYDRIKSLNYLILDNEIKHFFSLFKGDLKSKILREIKNIIFWKVNINVQNKLKQNIYFLSDEQIFKNNIYYASKIKKEILSVRSFHKSIKIKNRIELDSFIKDLNYSLKKVKELKIIKNNVEILSKDLNILFKFGYN